MKRMIVALSLVAVTGCWSPEAVRSTEPLWQGEIRSSVEPLAECAWKRLNGRYSVELSLDEATTEATLRAYQPGEYVIYDVHLRQVTPQLVSVSIRANQMIGDKRRQNEATLAQQALTGCATKIQAQQTN